MFVNAITMVPHHTYQLNFKSKRNQCVDMTILYWFFPARFVHRRWLGIPLLTPTLEALMVVGERKQAFPYTQMECNLNFGLKTGYKLYATITSRLNN